MSSDNKGKKHKHHRKNGHWKYLILGLIVVAVIVTMVIRSKTRDITLTLNGPTILEVDANTHYNELGAKAVYGNTGFSLYRKLPIAVSVSGNVDITMLGDYVVTYTAAYGGRVKKQNRIVRVVDHMPPEITLETKEGYYTPIGGTYEEEGFYAYDACDGDVTADVVREDLGDGTIRYSVKDKHGNEGVVVRTIPYDDRTKPVVTLNGGEEMLVDADVAFSDPGCTAIDDIDGDITASVIVTTAPGEEENQTIYTYTATDSHGNSGTATRLVIRQDPNLPMLILEGDETITLIGGNWYKEPGYHASDRKDGDLTSSVKIDGEVTYWHVGTYTLTYTVTDSDGYEASAQRTVIVKARELPEPVDPGEKTIYLTFDDGPSKYTKKLLEVLDKYDVKATFFVTHNHSEADEMIVAEHEAGHTVAVHTYTHDYAKIYKSEKDYFDDMNKINDIIEKLTGERAAIIRFPGGSSNHVSMSYSSGIMTRLAADMAELGILYYDWNVDSGDAGRSSPGTNAQEYWEPLFGNVKRQVTNMSNGGKFSIVLQHDVKNFSVNEVENIIKWGLENGYTFKAIDLTTPTTGGVHQRIDN
jgi:Predicted xylanase/chitin deacetylase